MSSGYQVTTKNSYQDGYANVTKFQAIFHSTYIARRPIARARLLSVHTQLLSGQNKVKKVCGPKAGARARDRAPRDVRTTKIGLKICKICMPILVGIFCCDLIATGQGLMNSNS